MDRRIKIRHLQCFVEIVRHGSFKQAGQRLALAQPSISKTIAELEEIVGERLLIRSRAGVQLTDEGQVFAHYARIALTALQQGTDSLAQRRRGPEKLLSVGALPTVAAWLMPQVAAQLRRIDPNIILRVQDGPHRYLLDALRAGGLDVVIGRIGPSEMMQDVSFTQLYTEAITIVTRPDHPILKGGQVSDIPNWHVILPPPQAAIYPVVQSFLLSNGIAQIPNRLETVSGAFARVYVPQSDAIWFVSAGVVANELRAGKLVEFPANMKATQGSIGVMMRFSDAEPAHVPVLKTALQLALGDAG